MKIILLLIPMLFGQLAFAKPGSVRVVQCNIEDGGRFTNGDSSRETWDTARRFAHLMASDSLSGASVIGMQEIAAHDTKVLKLLEDVTGRHWLSKHYEQGVSGIGSGISIYWDPLAVGLIEDFGTVDIDRLDNGYILRFGGALFQSIETGVYFGFFTGKLAWSGENVAGHGVGNLDRILEVQKLFEFIRKKMANHASSARIITMDANSSYHSSAWRALAEEFQDGGSNLATFDSHYGLLFGQKLDYIWWGSGASMAQENGFLTTPRRSEHFGSDHRFVWADVRVE